MPCFLFVVVVVVEWLGINGITLTTSGFVLAFGSYLVSIIDCFIILNEGPFASTFLLIKPYNIIDFRDYMTHFVSVLTH